MASIANIVIADGKATPLNHTYVPIQDGPESILRTQDSTLPLIGQEVIKVKVGAVNVNVNKTELSIDLPALETATAANSSGYTAAPKVAYTNRVVVSFMLPTRGTAGQRTDLRVLLKNLLTNAIVIDAIDNVVPAN